MSFRVLLRPIHLWLRLAALGLCASLSFLLFNSAILPHRRGDKAKRRSWAAGGANLLLANFFFQATLTPALPPARERENRRLPFGKSRRRTGRTRIRKSRIGRHLFLLPGGEGQDEGEPFTKTDLRPQPEGLPPAVLRTVGDAALQNDQVSANNSNARRFGLPKVVTVENPAWRASDWISSPVNQVLFPGA